VFKIELTSELTEQERAAFIRIKVIEF